MKPENLKTLENVPASMPEGGSAATLDRPAGYNQNFVIDTAVPLEQTELYKRYRREWEDTLRDGGQIRSFPVHLQIESAQPQQGYRNSVIGVRMGECGLGFLGPQGLIGCAPNQRRGLPPAVGACRGVEGGDSLALANGRIKISDADGGQSHRAQVGEQTLNRAQNSCSCECHQVSRLDRIAGPGASAGARTQGTESYQKSAA